MARSLLPGTGIFKCKKHCCCHVVSSYPNWRRFRSIDNPTRYFSFGTHSKSPNLPNNDFLSPMDQENLRENIAQDLSIFLNMGLLRSTFALILVVLFSLHFSVDLILVISFLPSGEYPVFSVDLIHVFLVRAL